MDNVLIVIPVVNLWDEYTIHCMESIAASMFSGTTPVAQFEVVIVDNGSKDQTVEKANDFGGRKMPGRVHVLHNDENRGCAGGWNQGVAWGMERGFSHFLIANNDILIGPRTIENLYKRFQKRDGKLLVSAIDVMRELTVPQQVLDSDNQVNWKEDTEAPHPHFSCFMISKECVELVGYFDEEFFPAYFEDNDYHYRIKAREGENAAIATTTGVFVHYGSRTQNQVAGGIVPGDKFKNNEAYFIRKWGGPPGHEQFTKPFNDESKDLTYAKRTGE